MPSKIEDYAVIGDGHTAALVSRDGSIDWLCWPRFDSGACFAGLLGTPDNGRWSLAPQNVVSSTRCYRKETLVLETRYVTEEGAVTVVDFMPMRNGWSELVRVVIGQRGEVKMQMDMALRFDYGSSVPWVSQLEDGSGIKAISGPDMAVLRTTAPLRGENLRTVSEFTIMEGESIPFVLAYAPSHHNVPPAGDPSSTLARTETFWRDWTSRCKVEGEWADDVKRSLITLKALAYEPTGGIVAAATTSLPEKIGGTRNWDYRFCWLRDATLTLLAMMRAGFYDEARAWRAWLVRAIAGSPEQVQIMYGIAGERRLAEWECDWLPGYEDSKPVRIGNNAVGQLQLDVYGEVMSALHVARVGGLDADDAGWAIQCKMIERLEEIWRQPDEGIWEVRGGRQQFTFSKAMAWLAVDRGIRSAEEFELEAPLDTWRTLRDTIHADICEKGFNTELNSFVQCYGGKELDASLLTLAPIGFLPATDPRIAGTVEAIARDLTEDGLVKRYHTTQTDDGLPPGEGTFLACSFWLADNLLLLGRREEAADLYRRLVGLCNDVGLLAEEYDTLDKRMVGNFPQAFSHVALVHTGMNLMEHAEALENAAGHKTSEAA
ncbi:MAG: glycoside hydrolase family 15 protein [Janthinobacterium lividum]